jgi:hypothetical protein
MTQKVLSQEIAKIGNSSHFMLLSAKLWNMALTLAHITLPPALSEFHTVGLSMVWG